MYVNYIQEFFNAQPTIVLLLKSTNYISYAITTIKQKYFNAFEKLELGNRNILHTIISKTSKFPKTIFVYPMPLFTV
jgi:hypothetical protein